MRPLQLIHLDLWGPSPVVSNFSYRSYGVFVDEWSRFLWFFPLLKKFDLPLVFKDFLNKIELFFDFKVCVFRSDGGGEFTSKQFEHILSSYGIIHQFSCPYTPEQNGVCERKHHHLLDIIRTLLADSKLPSKFWVDIILTAAFLINRLPSAKLNNVSPYQVLSNTKSDILILKSLDAHAFSG